MTPFEFRLPMPDEELKVLADDLPLEELHGMAGMMHSEAYLFEAGGTQMKSLPAMYKVIVEKYGGENSLIAQWVLKVIEELDPDPHDSENSYLLAQQAVVLMVQKVRQFKAGN